MFIRRSNEDFLLQLIDFQQLSKFRNTLNLYPKIQIHQQLLPAVRSKFTKPLFIADTSQTKFFLGEWVELWDLRESRTIKKLLELESQCSSHSPTLRPNSSCYLLSSLRQLRKICDVVTVEVARASISGEKFSKSYFDTTKSALTVEAAGRTAGQPTNVVSNSKIFS